MSQSLTACVRYHEAGHAVVAYSLGAILEFVGAKGRSRYMRFPDGTLINYEGFCRTSVFCDYDHLVHPVGWNAPECDLIIKDIAILLGGVWAHKHHAGISFDEAALMGGAGDLAMADWALQFLMPACREPAKSLARAICGDTLKEPKYWFLVKELAENLKENQTISGKEAHNFLCIRGILWDIEKIAKKIPEDSPFWKKKSNSLNIPI
jgi:hypothetical protein